MTKPFWDYEETIGYREVIASDSVKYKVWRTESVTTDQQVAEVLSKIRRDINKLLVYLCKNPQLWMQHPISMGVVHTFDIHIPCWQKKLNELMNSKNPNDYINRECSNMNKLFTYQEMHPNTDSIIGLNKPKEVEMVKVTNSNGTVSEVKLGKRRAIFLTIRNFRTNKLWNYSKVLDLAIHELTHTTCNDVEWKEDNHKPPYQSYHTLMRRWAREAGVLKD